LQLDEPYRTTHSRSGGKPDIRITVSRLYHLFEQKILRDTGAHSPETVFAALATESATIQDADSARRSQAAVLTGACSQSTVRM